MEKDYHHHHRQHTSFLKSPHFINPINFKSFIKLTIFSLILVNASLETQWQTDMRLTNDPAVSFTSSTNTSTIAANGNFIHLVFYDNRSTDWEIYYKRSTDNGVSWSQDTRLTNSIGNSYLPTVVVNGSIVHLVWMDQRDGNKEIYYKRSIDNGISWGTDIRLTNDFAASDYPAIAVSGQTVHVAWYDNRDGNYEEYYKRSTNGGVTWEADIRLTNDSVPSWQPSISVSGQVVHLVWQDMRNGPNKVGYKRSNDGGATWSNDTLLANRFGGTYFPSISANGQNVFIVWEDYNTFYPEIYYKNSTNGGLSWSDDLRLTNNSSASGRPFVCVTEQNVHVTWWDSNFVAPGYSEIFYIQSTNLGNTWGPEVRLSNSPGQSQVATIAASGSHIHVAWYDGRDGNWEIYYKQNPIGNLTGVLETNSEIPSSYSLNQNYPNPFNPSTKIQFAVPKQSKISLKILDVTGRIAATILENVQMNPGNYVEYFESKGLASGVYFYSLFADGIVLETKKMVLLK